jgi:hypothetical protein
MAKKSDPSYLPSNPSGRQFWRHNPDHDDGFIMSRYRDFCAEMSHRRTLEKCRNEEEAAAAKRNPGMVRLHHISCPSPNSAKLLLSMLFGRVMLVCSTLDMVAVSRAFNDMIYNFK